MQNLINSSNSLQDDWVMYFDDCAALPDTEKVIVTANYWLANKSHLSHREIGICIYGDTDLTPLLDDLSSFKIVAIHFPAFTDGRGFSQARLLADRYHFSGEIRAIGDVLIDQLHFMKRCGINTFLLNEGISADTALQHFNTFTNPYQLAHDIKTPLFLRRS